MSFERGLTVGGSWTQTSGPSPGLGADRAIQNDREAMWFASRNEHWLTRPSVGNQPFSTPPRGSATFISSQFGATLYLSIIFQPGSVEANALG
jgi:hypothetical protein